MSYLFFQDGVLKNDFETFIFWNFRDIKTLVNIKYPTHIVFCKFYLQLSLFHTSDFP